MDSNTNDLWKYSSENFIAGKNFIKGELRIIFLHETTHELHKDIFWKQLCCFLQCIYWFHPTVKKLYQYFNEWSEAYCDFSVCRKIGSRKSYFSVICKIGKCGLPFQGCVYYLIYIIGTDEGNI